jgi:von Willebrand factor type A domain
MLAVGILVVSVVVYRSKHVAPTTVTPPVTVITEPIPVVTPPAPAVTIPPPAIRKPKPSLPTVPTPKNVNVVLVVDRSGSLKTSGSCAPLIASATHFVNQFTPGRNKLGLVTFATTTYVNFPISDSFQSAEPNVVNMLSRLDCAGSTSSAEALWVGYQQLIALNEPDALNTIVFFTDGNPTGVTVDMPVATSSPCSEFTAGSPAGADAYTMPAGGKGHIRGVYGSFTNSSQWFGLQDPNGTKGPDGLQRIISNDMVVAPNSNGCAYHRNWPSSDTVTTDFLGVPTEDIYGNSMNTSYRPVTLNADGFIDIHNNANAQAVGFNAADSAAANIRNGAVDPVSGRGLRGVFICSIGLGNAPYPLSSEFLERVSNSPRSPIYDATKRMGLYLRSPTGPELESAFTSIATWMLQLTK